MMKPKKKAGKSVPTRAMSMAAKATSKSGKKPASKLASLKNLLLGKGSDKKKADKQPAKGKAASAPKPVKTAKPTGKGMPSAAAPAPMAAKGSQKAKAPAAAAAPAPASSPTMTKGKSGKNSKLTGASHQASEAVARIRGASTGNGLSRSGMSAVDEAVCREVACEGLSTTGGYCRMHYIKNWKKIKRKDQILKDGKLNQYIEELVAKYPDKYIEAIRQDLANDKDFAKVIYDLDLDESVDDFDVENENVDSLIDNIKRDFEDEGESF
jgi:hypothetical protein